MLEVVLAVLPEQHDVIVITLDTSTLGGQRGPTAAIPPEPPRHFYTTNVKDKARVVDWLRHMADGIERETLPPIPGGLQQQ